MGKEKSKPKLVRLRHEGGAVVQVDAEKEDRLLAGGTFTRLDDDLASSRKEPAKKAVAKKATAAKPAGSDSTSE